MIGLRKSPLKILSKRVLFSTILGLAIAGCEGWSDLPESGSGSYLGSSPVVSGNTFDRYNDIFVVPPNSENLSISYQYELQSDERGDAVPGMPGPVWFYAERTAAVPSSFLQVALLPGAGAGVEIPTSEESSTAEQVSEIVRLGALDYVSELHCVDVNALSEVPAEIATFVRHIGTKGYGVPGEIFVRSYQGEKAGLDGRHVAIVVARDVTRLGYTCTQLGDLFSPDPEITDVVTALKEEASRSFEVVQ